jgi:CubicO group peptidase (beta-lactamase class C family)
MAKTFSVLLCSALLLGGFAPALAASGPRGESGLVQPSDVATRLDAYFSARAREDGLNGQVLVAENGRVLYHAAFGAADVEAGRANTVDTEFELASVSKVFTAVSVLQLVERGRIDLDAPLQRYFPTFPYPGITIRQLLSHSSGLSDQDIGDYERLFAERTGRPITMADLPDAVALADRPLKLRPGERWWYCNLGYALLAHLVEVRSGQPFQDYLRDHVTGPAGMRQTYLKTASINRRDTPLVARNYDYPHRYSPERRRIEGTEGYYGTNIFGPSNIVSTAADLLKLDLALRDGRLLKPETMAAAYRPVRLADGEPDFVWLNIGGMGEADDGLGWFLFRDRTLGRVVFHTGGMPGCRTIFLRDLEHGRTVILLDNFDSENGYKTALSGLHILAGRPPLETPKSLARQFGRTLTQAGATEAVRQIEALKGDTSRFTLSEDEMNNMGYEFLENGQVAQALATFEENTRLFPESDNVFNSYGEGLQQAGDLSAARDMYLRSLALNPENRDSRAALDRVEAMIAGRKAP